MSIPLAQHLAEKQLPLVEELSSVPTPAEALAKIIDLPRPLLLESARTDSELGRYSFLMADPFAQFDLRRATWGDDPFAELRAQLDLYEAESIDGLPPFQGGAAGLLSYELGHAWEKLPQPQFDEFQIPALAIGIYDWVIAWDHKEQRSWIIAHGFPEQTESARRQKADEAIQEIKRRLRSSVAGTGVPPASDPIAVESAHVSARKDQFILCN